MKDKLIKKLITTALTADRENHYLAANVIDNFLVKQAQTSTGYSIYNVVFSNIPKNQWDYLINIKKSHEVWSPQLKQTTRGKYYIELPKENESRNLPPLPNQNLTPTSRVVPFAVNLKSGEIKVNDPLLPLNFDRNFSLTLAPGLPAEIGPLRFYQDSVGRQFLLVGEPVKSGTTQGTTTEEADTSGANAITPDSQTSQSSRENEQLMREIAKLIVRAINIAFNFTRESDPAPTYGEMSEMVYAQLFTRTPDKVDKIINGFTPVGPDGQFKFVYRKKLMTEKPEAANKYTQLNLQTLLETKLQEIVAKIMGLHPEISKEQIDTLNKTVFEFYASLNNRKFANIFMAVFLDSFEIRTGKPGETIRVDYPAPIVDFLTNALIKRNDEYLKSATLPKEQLSAAINTLIENKFSIKQITDQFNALKEMMFYTKKEEPVAPYKYKELDATDATP